MASSPSFAATPNVSSALVSATAETSWTVPTKSTTLFTAGANGSKVEAIRFVGYGTTVAGYIGVFRYNGTTYYLVDTLLITVVTPSTTVAPLVIEVDYVNLELLFGDTLAFSSSVNSQLIIATAFGGNY